MKEPLYKIAEEHLGFSGKMISFSKSGYVRKNPDNLVVFNSNVCTEKGKIWWGDLDVTKSKDALSELAKGTGETIYVLFEMDGRFEHEQAPKINRAPIKFLPDGTYILSETYSHFKI